MSSAMSRFRLRIRYRRPNTGTTRSRTGVMKQLVIAESDKRACPHLLENGFSLGLEDGIF
jgi:hypothetical protein